MVFADVGCQFEETFQFFHVGADVHGRSRQNVGRTHKHGEAHLVDELMNVVHRRERAPFGLVYTVTGEHGRELGAVFGVVDV